eukprot:TRINITY_DN58126_c0_g1_i1.p1 TRINITY_DN58126_c0_g1~~TRINITY_DN58126_c0_g1_i1.p1  ORF type:complete len:133 (+),score=39.53 TRINITY_DN58126_c0_g1_i1:148-546(+)
MAQTHGRPLAMRLLLALLQALLLIAVSAVDTTDYEAVDYEDEATVETAAALRDEAAAADQLATSRAAKVAAAERRRLEEERMLQEEVEEEEPPKDYSPGPAFGKSLCIGAVTSTFAIMLILMIGDRIFFPRS